MGAERLGDGLRVVSTFASTVCAWVLAIACSSNSGSEHPTGGNMGGASTGGAASTGGFPSTGGTQNTGGTQSTGGAHSTISCAEPLPIEGDPDGPRSEVVWLECYANELNAGAIVTDPQGDFGNVLQRIAVFSSPECDAPIFEVFDDVFNDDPEDFSILFEREDEPELHAAICKSGAMYWPLEVHFEDEAGHVTSGRVQGFVAGLVPVDDAGGP